MGVNIEQLTKKQKQNFKNLRKQMSEQDNKVNELNKEIDSLKEKEYKSNKTLERLSLDIKEYKNNVHKIHKDMQDYTDKIDSITQEIKRLADLMAALHKECDKIVCNTSTQLEKLETIEDTIALLNKDFNLLESRVCNRYACNVQLARPTPVSAGSVISTFDEVREYNGQHFNQTTGKFVSPHDGLYLVCVTLHELGDKHIQVAVVAGGVWCTSIEVKCADTNAGGSVAVDMKKGQELFLFVIHADPGATLSGYSSFTIEHKRI
ncbi:uncharacterized protein LOC131947413 [Physella acuta]|uniref:uncharacterized protein LOC131947413 n=1 Tax=Physella acuta TaxID=109671 RepID=UPI0027DB2327|nr:uncharacterized protein LOC131947413 [Physella acuta]